MNVVATACLLFAIASIGLAIPFFWKQYTVLREWPEAKATVRRSDVVELTMSGVKMYATRFEFALPSPGSGIRIVEVNSYRQAADYGPVKSAAARFPVGKQVVVRVNPANAYDIRLDTDQPRRFFVLPLSLAITAIILFVTSVAIFFFARSVT
ncbi:MAG TPA: DUF3592 domain-containing protein [Terriglobales bacterium]